MKEAAKKNPKLASILKYGKIDLGDSQALEEYNKTVLWIKYGLKIQLPPGHLIPTVCLRSAFIHEVTTPGLNVLEIGTGSSVILALIAATLGCKVVATEANESNLQYAQRNIEQNQLEELVQLRACTADRIVTGVVKKKEVFDLVISYPPQYGSEQAINSHENKRGFGGHQLELIGGKNGHEFAVRLIQELIESSVLASNGRLALLLLNNMLAKKISVTLRHLKCQYEIIEVIAGTRSRYIVIGYPGNHTKQDSKDLEKAKCS